MIAKIISCGETMLRLSPLYGTRLENTPELQIYVAGSESNTLACLARLGFSTRWLSALPDTPLGRKIAKEIQGHGVDIEPLIWAGAETRLGTFYVDEAASPLGLQVYYDRAGSAFTLLKPVQIGENFWQGADLLHLTGITPTLSTQSQQVFEHLLEQARLRQLPISFDVNYRSKLCTPSEATNLIEKACQQAEILFCASRDAATLWNITGSPQDLLAGLEKRFPERDRPKSYVVTLGKEGAARRQQGQYSNATAFPSEGTHRFGSGDAFAAGYLYAYLQGPGYTEIQQQSGAGPLEWGNAVASVKRCIAGDIALTTLREVQALLTHHDTTSSFR